MEGRAEGCRTGTARLPVIPQTLSLGLLSGVPTDTELPSGYVHRQLHMHTCTHCAIHTHTHTQVHTVCESHMYTHTQVHTMCTSHTQVHMVCESHVRTHICT